MNRKFQYRCIFLCGVLVIALSGLSGRLIQIQLVNRTRYTSSSHKAFQRIEKLPATRGMIVDRNEKTLAKSNGMATLYVDKNHLYDPNLASYGLAYEQASSQAGWEDLDAGKRMRRIHGLRAELLDSEDKDAIVQKHLAHAVSLLALQLGMRREELRARIETSPGKWVALAKDIPEELADSLRERMAHLRTLVLQAQPLVPQLVEQQRQRFLERWRDAMALSDGATLPEAAQDRALSEATAFAIRIDVAEELTRLNSHFDEIDALLAQGGKAEGVGKRLDFLIQELHREANTLGSKSATMEMTRISVDMKVLIEQLREQVQNLE